MRFESISHRMHQPEKEKKQQVSYQDGSRSGLKFTCLHWAMRAPDDIVRSLMISEERSW
jgi:hypothetical protein